MATGFLPPSHNSTSLFHFIPDSPESFQSPCLCERHNLSLFHGSYDHQQTHLRSTFDPFAAFNHVHTIPDLQSFSEAVRTVDSATLSGQSVPDFLLALRLGLMDSSASKLKLEPFEDCNKLLWTVEYSGDGGGGGLLGFYHPCFIPVPSIFDKIHSSREWGQVWDIYP